VLLTLVSDRVSNGEKREPMDKRRVLVVDDEENMRYMLTQILKKGGYSVVAAQNG
jgi:CheY-like chemotaxis protein